VLTLEKERRPTQIKDRQNASMILVGNVADKTAILVDDLADTCNTITRAAKLLKTEGAKTIYALVTHGVLSGDAIDRINASALDKVVVTNSVDQDDHKRRCPKLEVLEVGTVFAEASVLCLPCSQQIYANWQSRLSGGSIMERALVYSSNTIRTSSSHGS